MSALAAAIAFAVSLAVIAAARRTPLARALADHPNARSLHAKATPRVGGLGVMAGSLAVVFTMGSADTRLLAGCAAGLAVLSLVDDARGLPALLRLAGHLLAAAIAVTLVDGAPGPALGAAVVLAIAWMANLFNFMDGTDGLAGLMALIGFGALGFVAASSGHADLATAAGALATASLAFLLFNAPPARVFLGDAGSIPLGFLAGSLGWLGTQRGVWPWWFPLLVFSPFIADATVTLLRRAAAGERVWEGHRTHYYQRLVTGGWSHRRLALCAGGWMLAVAASAVAALGAPALLHRGILLFWAVAYVALMAWIDRRYPRRAS